MLINLIKKGKAVFELSIFSYIFEQKVLRNAFIYIASNAMRSAIPFFLLPILTRYLTPFDYGIVATFQVLLAIVMVFVNLQMGSVVAVNFFKLNKQEFRVYIGNVIFIVFISFFLTFSIIYVLKRPLSCLIKFPENWVPIAVVVALCQSIFTLPLTLWEVEQKPLPYGIFQILQTFLNVSLSLVFVVMLGWQWQGRLLGTVIASIAFALIGVFIICKRKYLNFSFNKRYIRDALFFGMPLIPHALGWWIMVSIDRIFINSMVGVAATGIYTVGYRIGMIISLLTVSFNRAWFPFLFQKLKEDNYSTKVKIVKLIYLYDAGIIALALALGFVAPYFLKFLVGKSFYSAYRYVMWIALGCAANGMYFMVANFIFYVKKTYIFAWTTSLSAAINIGLNYFLIRANGAIGAAQATTITFFISFVLTWILSAKVYKMPWVLWSARDE